MASSTTITKPQADSVGFYENMRKLIPAVRAAGIRVLIVPHHRTRATDFIDWAAINPTQQETKRKNCFADGAWGGQFHPEFGPGMETWWSWSTGRRTDLRTPTSTRN